MCKMNAHVSGVNIGSLLIIMSVLYIIMGVLYSFKLGSNFLSRLWERKKWVQYEQDCVQFLYSETSAVLDFYIKN